MPWATSAALASRTAISWSTSSTAEAGRVGKKVTGALVKGWLWRGQLQPVAELDGAGNVVARFVYAGGVNVPALMVTPTATYRLVTDHLGSVRRVIDIATGAVAQELDYDAWGRVLARHEPGAAALWVCGRAVRPGYGARASFGARDYDAETARWTAKDPIRFGGGSNLYEYAQSNAMQFRDPRGRDPEQGEWGGWEGPPGPPVEFGGDPDGAAGSSDVDAIVLPVGEALLIGLESVLSIVGCGTSPSEPSCTGSYWGCDAECGSRYEPQMDPLQMECKDCCVQQYNGCLQGLSDALSSGLPVTDPGSYPFSECYASDPTPLPFGGAGAK
jgi:RHS repeat-associated protein